MAAEDLSRLDATAQAELVRDGEATPVELVDAAIERIEAVNPEINAVITPLFEKAREAAAGELPNGPFRGVPTLLKDLLAHSAGDPFHEGMKHLRDLDCRETIGHLAGRALPRGRIRDLRQDQHAGARHPRHHRARGLRRRPATPGTPNARLAARAEDPRRRSLREWCRSPTAATAAARSASPRRPAGSSG